MNIQELAVKHSYYCSDSNYYSNDAAIRYQTMTDFLDDFEGADIDMNMVFRWDVRESRDEDTEERNGNYNAEIFIIHQRKGKFVPVYVAEFRQHEVGRFLAYAKKHWDYMRSIWEPVS